MFVFFEELNLIGSKIAFKTTKVIISQIEILLTYLSISIDASNISFIFWNWRLDSLAKEFYFNMLSPFGKYLGLWQLDDRYFGGLFQFVFHDGIFEMIGNYVFKFRKIKSTRYLSLLFNRFFFILLKNGCLLSEPKNRWDKFLFLIFPKMKRVVRKYL